MGDQVTLILYFPQPPKTKKGRFSAESSLSLSHHEHKNLENMAEPSFSFWGHSVIGKNGEFTCNGIQALKGFNCV